MEVWRCWHKPAVRVHAGDEGEVQNTATMSYGAGGEFTLGIHFRLEDCYGGSASKRNVIKKYDDTAGVGWEIYYDVATGELVYRVSDGTGSAEVRESYDEDEIDWRFMLFTPGVNGGLIVYKRDEMVGNADTLTVGDINNSVPVRVGDSTSDSIAMMFGGAFMTSDLLTEEEIESIVQVKDSQFGLDSLLFVLSGEDDSLIDESNYQWLDASGNGRYIRWSSSVDMKKNIQRPLTLNDLALIGLEMSVTGSRGEFITRESSDVGAGDTIVVRDSNGTVVWNGYVVDVIVGRGGKRVNAVGYEQHWGNVEYRADNLPVDYVFYDLLSAQSNLVYSAPSVNTNLEINGDFRRDLGEWAMREGMLLSMGLAKVEVAVSGTPITLTESNSGLVEVKETAENSYSEVRVVGYTGTDITVKESFTGNGVDDYVVLSYYPRSILKIEIDGVETWAYRVDGRNKTVKFTTPPPNGSVIDVYYTRMDIEETTVRDSSIEAEIGRRKQVYVEQGYWSSTDANRIANSLLRSKYLELEMRIRSGSFSSGQVKCGQLVTVSYTNDVFGVNGSYVIRRVKYEYSVDVGPMVELVGYTANKKIVLGQKLWTWAREVRRLNRVDERGW